MRQTVAPRGGGALSSPGTGTSSGSGIATTAAQQTRELRAQSLDAPNPDPPPDGDRSQSGTPSPGEEALRSPPESGAKTQPVPQHDPGDGLPYTERVRRRCPIRPLFLVLILGAQDTAGS